MSKAYEGNYKSNIDEGKLLTAQHFKPQEDFDEEIYLKKYPDVAHAVAKGVFPNGRYHYLHFGMKEGRSGQILKVTNDTPLWKKYLEFAIYHKNAADTSEFEDLMKKIENKTSFHIARYCDGEWVFILQIKPHINDCITKNHHPREEVLAISEKLAKIVDSKPEYYIGIDSTTRAMYGLIADAKMQYKEKVSKIKNIVYGDLFNAATIRYGIKALLEPLQKRTVISVGPAYMESLGIAKVHISVLHNNCWREAEQIEKQLDVLIEENLNNQPVILYSCSMLAKLLVDINYHKYRDKITQMDIGSCIDPWCGVMSRPWHHLLAAHYHLKANPDLINYRK